MTVGAFIRMNWAKFTDKKNCNVFSSISRNFKSENLKLRSSSDQLKDHFHFLFWVKQWRKTVIVRNNALFHFFTVWLERVNVNVMTEIAEIAEIGSEPHPTGTVRFDTDHFIRNTQFRNGAIHWIASEKRGKYWGKCVTFEMSEVLF
jgi:hypothetical protein